MIVILIIKDNDNSNESLLKIMSAGKIFSIIFLLSIVFNVYFY